MREVLFYNEGIAYPDFFSEDLLNEWLDSIARYYSRKIGSLSFIFCNDSYILNINQTYLNHDYYTDVITFDYCQDGFLSGDIFISFDTVLSNSLQFNTLFIDEFHRVFCHSVLHLIGFKDKTELDSTEMRENENLCLELLKTIRNDKFITQV